MAQVMSWDWKRHLTPKWGLSRCLHIPCFLDIWTFSIINPAANLAPPGLTHWAEPGSWRPCTERGCSFREIPKTASKLAPRTSAELGLQSAWRHTSNFPLTIMQVFLSLLYDILCFRQMQGLYLFIALYPPPPYLLPFLSLCMAVPFPGRLTVGLKVYGLLVKRFSQ